MDEALFQQRLDAGYFDNIKGIQLENRLGSGPDQLTRFQFLKVTTRQRQRLPHPAPVPAQPPVQHPVVAPPRVNEQQHAWKDVKDAGIDISEEDKKHFTRRYWLRYFWGEAVARADARPDKLEGQATVLQQSHESQKSKDEVAAKFKAGVLSARTELIQIHEKLFPKNINTGVRSLTNLDQIDEQEFCTILCRLLHIGFRGAPINARPLGRDGRPSNIISYCRDGKDHLDVRIGWRSESRSWDQIVKDKGTKRQVDVDTLADRMNLRAKWHPFSIEKYRDCLWVRAGLQMDNCLYSVVSVGNDFKTVSSFPLIVENPWGFPQEAGIIKPLETWSASERNTHRENIARVRLSDGQEIDMVATTVYIYMFLLRGVVLDTQQVQEFYGADSFPERGVKEIKLDDIFAYCNVVRVHHGFGQQDGHTGFIRQFDYAFRNKGEREHKYGDALQQLESSFQNVAALRSFATAWRSQHGRIGLDPANVRQEVDKIHGELPLRGRRIMALIRFPTQTAF